MKITVPDENLEFFVELRRDLTNEKLHRIGDECYHRCSQAFRSFYSKEKEEKNLWWSMDERNHDNDMLILYERFCYAMALACTLISNKYITLHGVREFSKEAFFIDDAINLTVDKIFNDSFPSLKFKDGVLDYYSVPEDEDFWESETNLLNEIISAREKYSPEERSILNGFESELDDDENLDIWEEKDFLHIKRVVELGCDLDIEKFLIITKDSLPSIIRDFFLAQVPSNRQTRRNILSKLKRFLFRI